MSIYETMQDGLCGFFRQAENPNGRCLETALQAIERDPYLKLMMGPPGASGDTAHFWAQSEEGEIVDGAPDRVPDDYPYEGREVDPESVRKELEEQADGAVWHASDSDFDEFIFKEIGFHFAETKELAENAARLNGKNSAVARPYKITSKNMVEITGQKNGFRGYDLIDDMMQRGYISKEQHDDAIDALYNFEDHYEEYEDLEIEKMEARGYYLPFDSYNQAEATVLKRYFDEWGIDGFKYWNTFDAYGLASLFGDKFNEGSDGVQPSWSYIVLDNSQITPL